MINQAAQQQQQQLGDEVMSLHKRLVRQRPVWFKVFMAVMCTCASKLQQVCCSMDLLCQFRAVLVLQWLLGQDDVDCKQCMGCYT
jgi:hypothetical protein